MISDGDFVIGDKVPNPWDCLWIGATDEYYDWLVFHKGQYVCSWFPPSFMRFEFKGMESNAEFRYLAQLEPMHSMFMVVCPECVTKVFVGSFGVVP